MNKIIKKGWGHEEILDSNELYCFKKMWFEKEGNEFSFHFHKEKTETWFVSNGSFKCLIKDMKDNTDTEYTLNPGAVIRLMPMTPHKLIALEDESEIMEVSTLDSAEDNYRIGDGDSQRVV
jgi:mannose-6-phosphate isomerase-like protein (cupin superfamily)